MQNILVTGATGHVGTALLRYFTPGPEQQLWIASRKPAPYTNEIYFDFEDLNASLPALRQTEVLFLLRPPQLASVKKYFAPLIKACAACGVKHIVFLSVQGADKAPFIPHAKIEQLIVKSGLAYSFLRPSYFMQNLSAGLRADICEHNRIFLPAGKAPFLWIDADDIGHCAARILQQPAAHHNKTYTVTGNDLLGFEAVAKILSQTLGRRIGYQSPSLWQFYRTMKKKGHAFGYIMVLMLLHFVPRLQKPPLPTNDVAALLGKPPGSLHAFIEANKKTWL